MSTKSQFSLSYPKRGDSEHTRYNLLDLQRHKLSSQHILLFLPRDQVKPYLQIFLTLTQLPQKTQKKKFHILRSFVENLGTICVWYLSKLGKITLWRPLFLATSLLQDYPPTVFKQLTISVTTTMAVYWAGACCPNVVLKIIITTHFRWQILYFYSLLFAFDNTFESLQV